MIVDDGKSGGDELRISMSVEGIENFVNFVGGPEIVLVREEKDIAGSAADGFFEGFDDAVILGMAEELNARRVRGGGKTSH